MNYEEIEDNSVIREIIDVAFYHTKCLNSVLLSIYLTFHVIPTIMQVMFPHTIGPDVLSACCMSSIFCHVFLIGFEFMDLRMRRTGLWGYITDVDNLFDIINITTMITFGLFRNFFTRSYMLETPEAKQDMQLEGSAYYAKIIMPFANWAVLTLTFTRILRFLKVYPSFGNLVELITLSFKEVQVFMGFMLLWAIYFALSFRMLGADFDDGNFEGDYDHDHGDYPLIPPILVLTFQSIRNAIGDLAPPHVKYWEARYNAGEHFIGHLFIYLIWAVWFANVGLMIIMLLNFLIAIISQVFERVSGEKMQMDYKIRAQQNLEVARYRAFWNDEDNRDFFILASPNDAAEKSAGEWQGMVKSIKKNFNNMVKLLKVQNTENHSTTMDKLEKLDVEQDKIREMLSKVQEKLGAHDMNRRGKKRN